MNLIVMLWMSSLDERITKHLIGISLFDIL
jgi:hypothetical protein